MDLNRNFEMDTGDVAAWVTTPVDVTGDGNANAVDLAASTDAVAGFGE